MSSTLIGVAISSKNLYARVAELVDALASGVSTARRKGSSPFSRTIPNKKTEHLRVLFFCARVMYL